MRILIKVMIGIMAIIVLMALAPTIEDMVLDLRGCSYFNCGSYTDIDASSATCSSTNQTFDTQQDENSLGCAIGSLITPILVLLIVIGVAGWIMLPSAPEPMYGGMAGMGGYTPGY